jgi:hypothetical protein
MISFLHWLFSGKKESLVPSAGVENPEFQVLNPKSDGENVLFDDGRIRVTPALILIGERKRIVVSQIREFQWGLLKENRLGWLLCKLILILLIAGALFFGLLEMWIYFTFCMIGVLESVWWIWKWPYSVSIRTSGLFGEYIEFSDQNSINACGKAIEAAIRARA